jgi:hypothetical protein
VDKFTEQTISMTFYGIADAHGLDSFIIAPFNDEVEGFKADPKTLSALFFRAKANRHRHAVVYQVELDGKAAQEVQDLYDGGEYVEALAKIKEQASEVMLMKEPGSEKSWRMIPNPDLDPYHN